MILQEIWKCNLTGVIAVKLVELIAYLQYFFFLDLPHLLQLVDHIFRLTALSPQMQ